MSRIKDSCGLQVTATEGVLEKLKVVNDGSRLILITDFILLPRWGHSSPVRVQLHLHLCFREWILLSELSTPALFSSLSFSPFPFDEINFTLIVFVFIPVSKIPTHKKEIY